MNKILCCLTNYYFVRTNYYIVRKKYYVAETAYLLKQNTILFEQCRVLFKQKGIGKVPCPSPTTVSRKIVFNQYNCLGYKSNSGFAILCCKSTHSLDYGASLIQSYVWPKEGNNTIWIYEGWLGNIVLCTSVNFMVM